MNTPEVLRLRLYNTGLSLSPFDNAVDALSHLGAVQAQDYSAAKWALGLRIRNSTGKEIESAFNDGTILRTHVMRPTWHFILPEDIRWMLELTAPQVKSRLKNYNRRLGLDDALFAKSNAVIVNALEGHNYLTRQELKALLADAGIETDVQRLGHIITHAELDGLICSGPRRGKLFTSALLDERVARSSRPDREQSLAKLALRYFTSHGPAQLKDFSWWSGLAEKEARLALDMAKSGLNQATIDTKTYWFPRYLEAVIPDPPTALLLSLYDEYTIAYRDRRDISEARYIERMIAMGNALTAVIVVNGEVVGAWKKATKKEAVEIRLNPFRELDSDEREAVEQEVERYGRFFGTSAVIVGGP
ncbi:MAG: winged helix DNA-binding domain-containing protein [Euryarchaeota archaeon]|nr:winged helix DNA-binding domain-containing protein [Euryarchaeota archaeon]